MRTDQTFLCVPCRLRFSPRASCPGCGRAQLLDLTTAPARSASRLRLSRRPSSGRRREWIGLSSAPSHRGSQRRSFLVGAAVLALVLASPWLSVRVLRTSPLVLGGIMLLAIGMWVALKAVAAAVLRKRVPFEIALAKASPEPPHPESRKLRGRIRALSAMPSPLHGRDCVAFRVIGTSFGGEVDDGGGVPFDLVLDDGSTVHVELPEAAVDVPVDDAPTGVRARAAARPFFEERGMFPDLGPLRLSEGLLVDGSTVEVTGLLRDEAVPDGYRDLHRVPTFRDRAEAPLRVRAV